MNWSRDLVVLALVGGLAAPCLWVLWHRLTELWEDQDRSERWWEDDWQETQDDERRPQTGSALSRLWPLFILVFVVSACAGMTTTFLGTTAR